MTIEHNAPQMPLPELSVEQARVFACLIEKSLATPNSYPLTINSLMLACNQKTNRHPVMALTEGEIGRVTNELVELSLAKIDYGERAKKVTHLATRELGINREEMAILAMLILREPLTISELKVRTEKMVGFASIAEVENKVQQLMDYTYPLLMIVPKSTGRREDRYTHLLSGEVDVNSLQEVAATNAATSSNNIASVHQLVEELIEKNEQIEARIIKLEEQLN